MLPDNVQRWTIEQFVNRLEADPGFAFARFGDGAFFCLQGAQGVNCDGAAYGLLQATELTLALRDTTITHGISGVAYERAEAQAWLDEHNIRPEWWDADVLNRASDEGNLWPFVAWLNQQRVVLVGPEHVRKVRGFFYQAHVPTHPTAAFDELDFLEHATSMAILGAVANVVLLSAGTFASPPLVSRLHRRYPRVRFLDVGSLWDPYCGVFSRSGHKRLGIEGYRRLRQVNLEGRTA